MNTKPFDLEAAKRGEAVVDGLGRPVKFLLYVPEALPTEQVIFLSRGSVAATRTSGVMSTNGTCKYDLFMIVKTKTVWINLYRSGSDSVFVGGGNFDTEQDAATHTQETAVDGWGGRLLRTVSVELPA